MTDGTALITTSKDPLTLKDIKKVLDNMSEKELEQNALFWKINNKKCIITSYRVREIHKVTEDQINPSGDGLEPKSNYDSGEMDDEPVVIPQGTLIFNLSKK